MPWPSILKCLLLRMRVSFVRESLVLGAGSSKAKKLLLSGDSTRASGVLLRLSCMMRSFLSWFQSYALLSFPAFTPTTHDLLFQEAVSVPVSLLVLVPLSYLRDVS